MHRKLDNPIAVKLLAWYTAPTYLDGQSGDNAKKYSNKKTAPLSAFFVDDWSFLSLELAQRGTADPRSSCRRHLPIIISAKPVRYITGLSTRSNRWDTN